MFVYHFLSYICTIFAPRLIKKKIDSSDDTSLISFAVKIGVEMKNK